MWSVVYAKDAVRALLRMPRNVERRIRAKIDALARDPSAPNNNVKALKGRPGFRLRVGDWRVIYDLDRGRLVVLVIDIGPRGGVYN